MKQQLTDRDKCGIYVIRNKVNGKVYVGKSINIYKRIKQHVTNLNTKSRDENRHLIRAWHKYGRENFDYEVLEYLPKDDTILKTRELHWMTVLNSTNRTKGYNMRMDTSTNCIVQEETRDRMSAITHKRFADKRADMLAGKAKKKVVKNKPRSKERLDRQSEGAKHYKILQFSKAGVLLHVWGGVREITTNTPYKIQNIYAACNGGKPTGYGYLWRYWDKATPVPPDITPNQIVTETTNIRGPKVVYCFDSDFNFVAQYASVQAAAIANGLGSKSISTTCRGDKRTHYHAGMYWYYITNIPPALREQTL